MAVVINEFEVVPQAPPTPQQSTSTAAVPEPASVSAEEIAEQMRRQHQRRLRVRAH